jgi:hypothetical protein
MKKSLALMALGVLPLCAWSAALTTITIEAEDMSRSGYILDGKYIKIASGYRSGTARQTFSGPSGIYKVEVHVMPETDGLPRLEVYVGDSLLKTFDYPLGGNRRSKVFTIPRVKLAHGDVIRLVGHVHAGALARVDKIVLIPVTTSAAPGAPRPGSLGSDAPAATGASVGSGAPAATGASVGSGAPAADDYPKQGATGGLPVIPGATGFGINTRAGRGGTVHRVTNLNERGPGTLRACVEASRPRICVFEVSGTILLSANLTIRHPQITVAGQTAPSPGITLRGAGLAVTTHDVLVQHLRIRVGDSPAGPRPDNRDAIMLEASSRDVYNVVIDHVSASWSTDELLSTYATGGREIRDVTIRYSLFAEALNRSIHPKGEHSAGVMIGPGTSRVSIVKNVFAFNAWRNPLVRDDSTDVVVINNLVYRSRGFRNDQINFGSRGRKDVAMRAAVVGNSFIAAAGAKPTSTLSLHPESPSEFRLYQKDNLGPLASNDAWSVVGLGGRSRDTIEAQQPPVWSEGLVPMAARHVEPHLLRYAGARPSDRDAVDRRIVASIRDRTGAIIDSPRQVGGWPVLAENRRPLTLPDHPHQSDNDGYTRLERWLHELARQVEAAERLD